MMVSFVSPEDGVKLGGGGAASGGPGAVDQSLSSNNGVRDFIGQIQIWEELVTLNPCIRFDNFHDNI